MNQETYIYKSAYTYRAPKKGWELENTARPSEPVMERWEEESSAEHDEQQVGMRIFGLSGGVLGHSSRTSNRIDGLLLKMIENQSSAKYLGDIDRNLDYLFTCLQLDLIERIARDVSPIEEDEPRTERREEPETLISLDRVRPSF